LRQRAGDVAEARQLLDQAQAIFRALGTLDEPGRIAAALAARERGLPISMLAGVRDTSWEKIIGDVK
jgi:hypothetical protein